VPRFTNKICPLNVLIVPYFTIIISKVSCKVDFVDDIKTRVKVKVDYTNV
jgi:hypothetical protein